MKRVFVAIVVMAALSSGCAGIKKIGRMLESRDGNVVISKSFTPDPHFGKNLHPVKPPAQLDAKAIANDSGTIRLELVVGPKGWMAGGASGVMVEFAGRPHIISAGHINSSRTLEAIYAYFSEGQEKPEEVEIIAVDKILDLALLRFKNPNFVYKKAYPQLGSSTKLRKGEKIFAHGSPFGYHFMVREGVVSMVSMGLNWGFTQPQLILHDATINPGDSGGPLKDAWGNVVGLNVLGSKPDGPFSASTTIPGTIPIDDIKRVLRNLKAPGVVKHPNIGLRLIHTGELNDMHLRDEEIKRPDRSGLLVYRMFKKTKWVMAKKFGTRGNVMHRKKIETPSPAETGGVKLGDIVLSVDGHEFKTYNRVASYILFECVPNQEIELKVYRFSEKKELTLKVKLELLEEK